jgi:hypothetical protein
MHILVEQVVLWGVMLGVYEIGSQDLSAINDINVTS